MLKIIKAIILVSWFSITLFHLVLCANSIDEDSLVLHFLSLGISFIFIIDDEKLLEMNW